ncbi:hypothetical protein [Bacillus cereus]|uniref:hypothetical protein n=1 Tax=Bacillus cereus TaxID=1396 RepID=UPI000BF708FE|nr:hypothetical protein [Bacillus cereus]PFV57425.1 hypothetical protein COL00_05180 [Bacillus cereus]PGQ10795.1 hypothetical protein COA09_19210 [Bacillus cereus]PGS61447.1 hypothetical protein COC67_10150 [Bacillus cereus]PGV07365.1 hypothetical protein COD77_15945 [Bacillus cereus]
MGVVRLVLIIISLVLISPITANNEALFFRSRLAFYAMLLLEYWNIKVKAQDSYQLWVGQVGKYTTLLWCCIDAFGTFNFIVLDKVEKEYFFKNGSDYPVLSYIIPNLNVDHYILFSGLLTIGVAFMELFIFRSSAGNIATNVESSKKTG